MKILCNTWERRPNPHGAPCCRCLQPCGDFYTVNTYRNTAMPAPGFYYYYCDACMAVLTPCYKLHVRPTVEELVLAD